jgi:hypothetical protein
MGNMSVIPHFLYISLSPRKKVTSCQKLARQVITGISTIPYKIQMVLNFEVKIEIFKTQIEFYIITKSLNIIPINL